MQVARVATMVMFFCVMVAIAILLAPSVGLRRYPRACVWVSAAGAAVAAIILVIQVAFPLTQGMLFAWPGDYFLAMVHSIRPDTPYPFSWNPVWAYPLGTLTPLIAAGGVFAVGAGYPALRAGARGALVPLVVGVCTALVYMVGAALAAIGTWYGIPL